MYAIIRIRGNVSISPEVQKTFELLNLRRVNNLSFWPENKENLKMLKKVENYATFGIVDETTFKKVVEKRGKIIKDKKVDLKKASEEVLKGKKFNEAGIKNCFRLSPPKKGFERKGIKKAFSIGGALGNRKEKINELIEKML